MTDRATDTAAIRAIIADHERAFNTKDPELLAAHFRDRSWAVGVNGVEIQGRAALVEQARAMLGGPLADQYARYAPGDVEFLGDDVAIAHMYATATTGSGEPLGVGHAMVALYVFARSGGTWEVVARQNTLVAAAP